jgi:hypothetical protein
MKSMKNLKETLTLPWTRGIEALPFFGVLTHGIARLFTVLAHGIARSFMVDSHG